MKKDSFQKLDFSSRELDSFLEHWLRGSLEPDQLEQARQRLTYDARFREEFCDWIKSFRDRTPGGHHA